MGWGVIDILLNAEHIRRRRQQHQLAPSRGRRHGDGRRAVLVGGRGAVPRLPYSTAAAPDELLHPRV